MTTCNLSVAIVTAKKVRLRSVALFNNDQIIAFVKLVEALPLGERFVENLYNTTY